MDETIRKQMIGFQSNEDRTISCSTGSFAAAELYKTEIESHILFQKLTMHFKMDFKRP